MRAVILDLDTMGQGIDLAPIEAVTDQLDSWPLSKPQEVAARLQGAEIAITNKALITREVIEQSPELKLVCVLATGTNNIDMEAAHAAGIQVRNVTAYGTPSITQHTLTMILALATRLKQYDRALANGAWQQSPTISPFLYPATQLAGKQLAIVGAGELGKETARLAEALGMHVVFAARPGNPDDSRPALGDLLPHTDVISIHCPLTAATAGLINRDNLSRIKRGALLVNCSRGGIIDEEAALDALREGQLGGLGVDVLPEEPPVNGHALLDALDEDINLLVSPHIAWATPEARQRIIEITADNIRTSL